MKFHPLADLFPLMEGTEFDGLVESIKVHGLREPITLLAGAILDGRNRFLACEKAKIEPRFEQFTGTDPFAFVADMNVHRRHLSPSQLGIIGARMATWKVGENQFTRKGVVITTPSGEQAAAMLGIHRDTVQVAKVVLNEGTPQEIKAVEQGEVGARTVADRIRARNPDVNRRLGRPNNQTVGVQNRLITQRLRAKMWGQLRDALTNLTSLPKPSEVVILARHNDKTGLINARLSKSLEWLTEFSNEWNRHND